MNIKEKERDFTNSEVIDMKEKIAEKEVDDIINSREHEKDIYTPLNNSKSKKMKETFTESYINNAEKRINYNKLSYYLISFYGGLSSITELAVSYHFKDVLKIQPSELSRLTSLIVLPWSLKPFLGLLTDFCPIFGYKRKFYIILCGLLSMYCWFTMATMEPSLFATFLCLFFINIAGSFGSVLGEAIVVELARDKGSMELERREALNNNQNNNDVNERLNTNEDYNNRAKDYVSIFMIFKYSGVLFASFMKGSLVESIGIRGVFTIGIFLPILVLLAGLVMIDKKVNNTVNSDPNSNNNERDRRENNYNTISETGGPESNAMNREIDRNIERNRNNQTEEQEEHATTPSFSEMMTFLCQANILLPIMFIVLFMATPSYSDPFFYFLTNSLNFSASSLGKISFCSTIGVLLGIFTYKTFFKTAQFKNVIVVSTILSFLFSFCGYLLVKRVNVQWGINDFWFVLLSNSVLSMIGEVMLLPMLSIACVLCPKNMEGTIFSVFMSAMNFGGTLSGLFGSIITAQLGITSTNYDNLSCLILIANIFSLMPLPLLYCLSDKYFKH